MNDVPFHLTVMGRRFYEVTVPALVEAIERLNANMERAAPAVATPVVAATPPTPELPIARATTARASAPGAKALVELLTDDLGPALAAMITKVHAAEETYTGTPGIREEFDNHEADDGWASLRYYLEHAAVEVRRILKARR